MFHHLRITLPPIIPPTDLTGFGRINLICGKNNSGKTTLLKAIADPAYRKVGTPLAADDLKIIINTVDEVLRERGARLNIPTDLVLELLGDVAKTKKLWTDDEFEQLGKQFEERRANHPTLRVHHVPLNLGKSGYSSLIGHDFHEPILIPPQRRLETITTINLGGSVKANGIGLLNYLFHAKNQPNDSEDNKVLRAIQDAFTVISSGYVFDIFTQTPPNSNVPENKVELRFARSNVWVKADDCGLGLQDLIVLLYFTIHPSHEIVLIEEPETHLHPEMQKKLLYYMREETNKQFFMSTHSNVFLNNALTDKVLFTTFNGEIIVDDVTSRASILDDLGYSVADNLVSDLVILLEGPKDVPVIEELLVKLGLFAKYEIKMWPLGGDIMGQVDLTVFAEKYQIIALVDHDPGSERTRRRFIKKCQELNIPVTRLKRYAIENYFSVSALRAVFKGQIPASFTEVNPDQSLEIQLGMNVKNRNRQLAEQTNIEDISDTDLYRFLLKVQQLCAKPKG